MKLDLIGPVTFENFSNMVYIYGWQSNMSDLAERSLF